MENSDTARQECNANELIEDISKIQQNALGNGAGARPGFDDDVGEGDEIVAYVYKPALNKTYSLGRVVPAADAPPITEFTLGVRELLVRGRIGTCSDQATQSSWPVLLAPHILTVSHADTTEGTDVEDQAYKATVPATEEPDIWPLHLPEGELELIDAPATTDEGRGD